MHTPPVADPAPRADVPAWARLMRRLTDYLSRDCLEGWGGHPWKLAWVIDLQKAGTFVFLGVLLAKYGASGPAVWVYLALHGTYGLVWLLKDLAFPDPSWQQRVTIAGGVNAFLFVLGPYWLIGWLLFAGVARPVYPLPVWAWLALCISLCMFGCALMIAADAQKTFTLRLRRGLITDGVFRYVRHPNYLGEMMVYGSFALLVWHWLPVLILAWVWIGVFLVNMLHKEASLARYPGWASYRERSWWLVPFVV
jgi:protein-S-isoprenylcysteine O-methyltransferase Ste14